MDLCLVSLRQDVGIRVSCCGVSDVVPTSSNDGEIVAFHLNIGLWTVRRSKDVLDSQDLAVT